MSDDDTACWAEVLANYPRSLEPSLERVRRLLGRLGNPERRLPPVVHVTGTNGKGSVISYCRAILETAGRRVHVFTSPHLRNVRERVVLATEDGQSRAVAEGRLAAALRESMRANGDEAITAFELLTAAAFSLYAGQAADYLLLEVGMGGRYDATNTVEVSAVTVITPVSLDHTGSLGSDVASIAREKSGILRPGTPCVVGLQSNEALSMIRRCAKNKGSPVHVAQDDWRVCVESGRLMYEDGQGVLGMLLPFRHAIPCRLYNAGSAIATLRLLERESLSARDMEAGLQRAYWPGRLHRLETAMGAGARILKEGELWLDGAHNPAGGRMLAEMMVALGQEHDRPLVLVVGMMGNKDAGAFFASFREIASGAICIDIPGTPGCFPSNELAEIARLQGLGWVESERDFEDALRVIDERIQGARVLICGSLYVVGRVLDAYDIACT